MLKETVIAIIITTLMAVGSSVFPNSNIALQGEKLSNIEKAKASYLMALERTENAPIVESAIFHVVKLKQQFPAEEFDAIKDKLKELSLEGETETIRFKAYVAQVFISNKSLLNEVERQDYKDGEAFFAMLNQKLQDSLLSVSID